MLLLMLFVCLLVSSPLLPTRLPAEPHVQGTNTVNQEEITLLHDLILLPCLTAAWAGMCVWVSG